MNNLKQIIIGLSSYATLTTNKNKIMATSAEKFREAFAKFCIENNITEAAIIFEENGKTTGVCQFSSNPFHPHPTYSSIHDQLGKIVFTEYQKQKVQAN